MYDIQIYDFVTDTWEQLPFGFESSVVARRTMGARFPHELLAQRLDGVPRVRVTGPKAHHDELAEIINDSTRIYP